MSITMETKLTISRSLIMKNCLWWELMALFARTNILNEVLENILNGNFSENLCARKHHRPCGRSVITHKRFDIVINSRSFQRCQWFHTEIQGMCLKLCIRNRSNRCNVADIKMFWNGVDYFTPSNWSDVMLSTSNKNIMVSIFYLFNF